MAIATVHDESDPLDALLQRAFFRRLETLQPRCSAAG